MFTLYRMAFVPTPKPYRPDRASIHIERFSSDLEMKPREQNRNNKRTQKNFIPETFLEINRYFALTSHCNKTGQSNNAFSILGFSLAGKRRVHVLIFHPMADKTKNEHLLKLLFKVIRKSLYKNGDFGAISITERSCAVQISKVVSSYYTG